MRKASFFILAVLFLFHSACSTIYFEQSSEPIAEMEYKEWHHNGLLRLAEFSPPVDLYDRCEGRDWKTIRVEKTALQSLLTTVTATLYDPWEVSFICR